MRILQIVTMFTPDGAYGGPATVALNQCVALQEAGHDVEILASFRGYESPPESIRGITAHLFPAHSPVAALGFAGTVSPKAWGWARHHLTTFDVVHVHLARDLVTLPIAWAAQRLGLPVLVQTHGMIDESSRILSRPLDALLTRRTLRRADAVFYLTEDERIALTNVARSDLPLESLPNGIAFDGSDESPYDHTSREVLFLARLQERKRPLAFVEAAVALKDRLPDVTFAMVGPDEGEANRIQARLKREENTVPVRWEGPVAPEHSATRMGKAALYVLPSVNEPFPMTVLEAMALGVPVIVTETCGLAESIRKFEAGLIVDTEVDSLSQAIAMLMDDPKLRQRMSRNAIRAIRTHFDLGTIVNSLISTYQRAAAEPNSR